MFAFPLPLFLALTASSDLSAPLVTKLDGPPLARPDAFLALNRGRMTIVTDAGTESVMGQRPDTPLEERGQLLVGTTGEAELAWTGRGSLKVIGSASVEWMGSPFEEHPLGLFDFTRAELEVRTGEFAVRLPGGVLLIVERAVLELVQRSSGVFGVHMLAGSPARVVVPAPGAPDVRELTTGKWIWIDPDTYLGSSRFQYGLEPEPEVPVVAAREGSNLYLAPLLPASGGWQPEGLAAPSGTLPAGRADEALEAGFLAFRLDGLPSETEPTPLWRGPLPVSPPPTPDAARPRPEKPTVEPGPTALESLDAALDQGVDALLEGELPLPLTESAERPHPPAANDLEAWTPDLDAVPVRPGLDLDVERADEPADTQVQPAEALEATPAPAALDDLAASFVALPLPEALTAWSSTDPILDGVAERIAVGWLDDVEARLGQPQVEWQPPREPFVAPDVPADLRDDALVAKPSSQPEPAVPALEAGPEPPLDTADSEGASEPQATEPQAVEPQAVAPQAAVPLAEPRPLRPQLVFVPRFTRAHRMPYAMPQPLPDDGFQLPRPADAPAPKPYVFEPLEVREVDLSDLLNGRIERR